MGALVSDSQTKNPNYPSHDTETLETVGRYLLSRNFIEPGERLERIEAIAPQARNNLLRVITSNRSFVIKQFRPWSSETEVRPSPGPDERFRAETQFYRAARIADCARAVLPEVLHQDAQTTRIILEDVGAVLPLAGRDIAPAVASQIGWFLVSLHHHSRSVPACAHYRNLEVVGWRMTQLFTPRVGRRETDWLEGWRNRSAVVRYALEDALGAMERGGSSLVHGDFSPANWVRNGRGPRVVDGEYSFFGPPEFDAGALLAGLLLEQADAEAVRAAAGVISGGCFRYDMRLVAAYAGVHLCGGLSGTDGSGSPRLRGSAASAVLRRLERSIDARSLESLVRI